jgi:nicotinamide-nucleotide amidase
MIQAALLPIGEELLSGAVTDTNSSWIASRLKMSGIPVRQKLTVGDDAEAILQGILRLLEKADILILTGGLGPTRDDVTKKCLLTWSQSEWKRDEATYERIRAYMAARGREVNPLNAGQADVPSKALVLPNYQGTAPGLWMEQEGKIVISLPGVPYEMKALMEQQVLPLLRQRFHPPVLIEEILHIGGIPESELALQIADIEEALPDSVKIAYLPEPGLVKVKLTTEATPGLETTSRTLIQEFIDKIRERVGMAGFAQNEETIESVVFSILKEFGKTLAVAESCTGGNISGKLVQLPGVSQILKGGAIAYSNDIKSALLGVKMDSLETYGAVSEQTAKEMALGVRKLCQTDFGLSVTGIAGPDGGSPEKPVGTVWVGVSSERSTEAFPFLFEQNRQRNIQRSVLSALLTLRKKLLSELKPGHTPP